MTCHLIMIETRTVRTPVGVVARRAVSAVSGIAGTAVLARSIMIAGSVVVAVVQVVGLAWEYFRTSAASLCVPGAAGAGI